MASASFNKTERAHQTYREGFYDDALLFYTEALVIVKTKAQNIACYLKLHDFNMAAAESTSVLELHHKHTGALMLRAQTLVTLNRLLELNPSSKVYQHHQTRFKTGLERPGQMDIETNSSAPAVHICWRLHCYLNS